MIYILFISLMIVTVHNWEYLKSKSYVMHAILFIGFYTFLPAMQYEVGVDYHAYIDMMVGGVESRISETTELFIFLFHEIIKYFDLNPQFIFFFYSFTISICVFHFIVVMKNFGYSATLLLFIYFTLTGYYFSQFNTLRQSLAISFVMLAYVAIYLQKSLSKYLIYSLLAIVSHSLAALPIFVLLAVHKTYRYLPRSPLILLIITSTVFLVFLPLSYRSIVELILPAYLFYLDEVNFEFKFLSLATKLYWLPLLAFYFLILTRRYYKYSRLMRPNEYLILLTIPLVFIMYLIPLHGDRVFQYFYFIWMFPVYFLMSELKLQRRNFLLSTLIIYISAPLLLKTLIFPSSEYLYKSVTFY